MIRKSFIVVALCATLLAALVAGMQAATTQAESTSQPSPDVICPQSPTPASGTQSIPVQPEIVGCYYPSVSATPSVTVPVGSPATFNYTISGADPARGCYVTDGKGFLQAIGVDGNGNASGSVTVGPFGSAGTYGYDTVCNATPNPGSAHTNVYVTDPSGGGGGGGGGGGSCTENDPTQLYSEYDPSKSTNPPTSVTVTQKFMVTITFKNTGQCTWTAANMYLMGSQNTENNTTWGIKRVALGPNDSILPGQTKTFTVNATAPATPGSYGWGWRMVREGINWFGPATNGTFTTINVTGSAPPPPLPGLDERDYAGLRGGSGDFAVSDALSFSASFCPNGSTYKGRQATVVFRNLVGIWLWKLHEDVRWCYNGISITRIQRDRYPEINNAYGLLPTPWLWQGFTSNSCNTENCNDMRGRGIAILATGGQFHFCSAKWFLCSTHTPYISLYIGANGGWNVVKWTS